MRKQLPLHGLHPDAPVPFRRSPVAAAVVAGLAILAAGPVQAADDKAFADLQAEVARLKQALDKSQQELSTYKTAQATPASPAPAVETIPAAATANAARADEPQTLDTVVVRSRNRIERLQDVPLSESVVTGKELERLGTTDIGAVLKRTGNITWNYGNQRTFSLSLRGIGRQGQTEAQDPAVGLIVDGVAYGYNALASSFDFTDVDTVEVTRGPQGTLLGKNASLGAVTITTRRPSFTPSADYSLTLGTNDTVKATFAAGGPIVDGLLAWRGSFSASKARGNLVNSYNNDLTYTNTDRLTGRLQFLLTPTADFSARLAIDLTPRAGEFTNSRTIYTPTPARYADGRINPLGTDASTRLARRWFAQDRGYSYAGNYLYGGADGKSVAMDASRPLVTGSRGIAAELNWNVGSHTLTSITAYKDYHFNAVNDEGTPFDVQRNSGGFWNDYKQVTQELRLSSQTGGFVDYQTGIYLSHITNFNDYRRVWGNDAGAWFATTAQYNALDADGAGRSLMQNSLANLSMSYNSPTGLQHIDNKSKAVFGQANWHLSEAFTVTTGLRFTNEDRHNTGSNEIKDNGNAPELNPSVVNGVRLGGFDSVYNSAHSGSTWNTYLLGNTVVAPGTAGAVGTDTIYVTNGQKVAIGTNISSASTTPGASNITAVNVGTSNLTTDIAGSAAATAQANAAAQKYFGVATWAGLSATQKKQLAYAQAIRKSQMGVLFDRAQAQPFSKTMPSYVFSPSYKINDNLTTYVSLQHGEKAGVSQFTNGVSNPVRPEKTTAYEWGVKSALFDRALILNTALFLMNVKDYQQTTQVVDDYTTALNNDGKLYYTNATGNVPKVQSKGLEIDGVYSGIRNLTIRFSGAYTDARYKEFPNSALPNEWNFTGNPYGNYRDLSGKTLPGASKVTYNVGIDYRHPVFGDKEFHTSANVAYASRWNSDVYLSDYAWIPANYVVDFAIGLGAINRSYDVSLLVKNALNDKTHLTQTWNSFTPAVPRWYGLQFTGKL